MRFSTTTAAIALALSAALAGPATASVLVATTAGSNGSFTIDFNDANGNNLFDFDELTGFSGFTSVFGQAITTLLAVPDIANISTAGVLPGATVGGNADFWYFSEGGTDWDLGSAIGNWTYEIRGQTVDLPATLPLMLAAFGALALARRRKQG